LELVQGLDAPEILEVGTGSGAIAIALAANLPHARIIATDLSADALSLAEENIAKCDFTDLIQLVAGNLFDPIEPNSKFDLIISNPPYIRIDEYPELMPEVKDYEPSEALLAGKDGLDLIQPLIMKAHHYLKVGDWLVFEFGINHAEPVKKLAAEVGKYKSPQIIIDYNQQGRGVILQCL